MCYNKANLKHEAPTVFRPLTRPLTNGKGKFPMASSDVTTSPYKTCSLCGKSYPATLEFFHKDKRIASGLKAACKTCTNSKLYSFRSENPHRVKLYANRYQARHAKERSGRARQWDRDNPEKAAARIAIHDMVYSGKMPRARTLECSHKGPRCKGMANAYHHHLGYAPEHHLDVMPVCSPCHKELDRKRAEMEAAHAV